MVHGNGKNFKKYGSLDPQSSSRVIEKRAGKVNKRDASKIITAPLYAHASAYPNGPALPTAPTSNWAILHGETLNCNDHGSGYIFMCNGKTKADCYKYRIFGLPAARMDILDKIKPHMKLFLFDFDLKLLYGVYIAISNGKLAIEPAAFGGKFSAQVRFEIFMDCLPLPESTFKHAIADNYRSGSKFKQDLNKEQVANLISLFRPVAVPSPVTAGSLMPNATQPRTVIPRSIEIQTRPAAALSASYDQYLAGLYPTHAGAAHEFRRSQQVGLYHASAANMDYLQPHLVPQCQSSPYYQAEAHAHQSYFPENRDLRSRYTAVPDGNERMIVQQAGPIKNYHKLETSQFAASDHGHAQLSSSSLMAAYWVKVASANVEQVYSSPHQGMSSGSTDLGITNIPTSFTGIAPSYPALQESRGSAIVLQSSDANDYKHNVALAETNNAHLSAVAAMPLQFQAPLHGSAHSSSLSSAALHWTTPSSEDPTHVHTAVSEGLPSGGTGYGAENMPCSVSGAALSYAAAPEKSEQENGSQLGYPYGYYHDADLSANVPSQVHTQLPSQVPATSYGSAHLPSSSGSASYWTGVAYDNSSQVYPDTYHGQSYKNGGAYVYNNAVVSAANAPLAHTYVPSQVQASHVPSSFEVDAHRYVVAVKDPNQV